MAGRVRRNANTPHLYARPEISGSRSRLGMAEAIFRQPIAGITILRSTGESGGATSQTPWRSGVFWARASTAQMAKG